MEATVAPYLHGCMTLLSEMITVGGTVTVDSSGVSLLFVKLLIE